jgi:hypothetical protein
MGASIKEGIAMAHREQRSNREKKKPKQDKNKKAAEAQRPGSVFAPQQQTPRASTPQPPQNKTNA